MLLSYPYHFDGDFLVFPPLSVFLIRHERNGPAASGPSCWKGLAPLQTFRKMGKFGCLLMIIVMITVVMLLMIIVVMIRYADEIYPLINVCKK